ncbi:MAG: ArsA family ATPase [Candidatus Freyarchaeota archaeon]|nr:ArsA family ATPase [Candidatus Jordarchaeia archaeon]
MFGGKGGVGKTSCSAASALWAAEHGKETLIISTDPAHSLSDSFDQQVGGEVKKIEGCSNLFALELDPRKAFEEYRKKLSEAEDFEEQAQAVLQEIGSLSSMTPPGTDEAIAFAKVLEFIEKPEYDLVVFDTAPTGHTLRLLSLPDILNSWVVNLIKIRVYMSKLTGLFRRLIGRGGEEDKTLELLEKLKETIGVARKTLKDPNETAFVIVMIPEAMAIFETERLLSSLIEYEIPCDHIIVNMIYPDIPNCPFCRARRQMQQENLNDIREIYDDFSITEVPLFDTEIRGLDMLKKLSEVLFA